MPTDPIRPVLHDQGVLVLDGGLATELEARGADLSGGLWSARLLVEAPDRIRAVHDAYLLAGADCLITATYQATTEGFRSLGCSETEAQMLLLRAVDLAREARDVFWGDANNRAGRLRPLVAASVGPYGAFCADGSEYTGRYDLDQAGLADFHRQRLALLAGGGADLLACETIPSAAEARALVSLLDGLEGGSAGRAAWISFTCKDEAHLSDGTPLAAIAAEVAACSSIVAIGVNCVAPSLVPALIVHLRAATDLPIVVYPNSGERWDAASQTWRGTAEPDDFAEASMTWRAAGATIIGGCCRTGPEHIRRLAVRFTAAC